MGRNVVQSKAPAKEKGGKWKGKQHQSVLTKNGQKSKGKEVVLHEENLYSETEYYF